MSDTKSAPTHTSTYTGSTRTTMLLRSRLFLSVQGMVLALLYLGKPRQLIAALLDALAAGHEKAAVVLLGPCEVCVLL